MDNRVCFICISAGSLSLTNMNSPITVWLFHMASHVFSLCLAMLPDKQANMENKPAEYSPLKSPAYLRRRTCSPDQSKESGEWSTSQNVNLLLQRRVHVQRKHSQAQGEIPIGLKRIACWGDDDCVCQSGLPRLYYSVSSAKTLYLCVLDLASLQLQLSPVDKVKGPHVMQYRVVCLLKCNSGK